MIYGIMVYWNEEFYIRQSMYSVLPFVDKLLLVDGAYYQYELDSYFSTDRSNSYIDNTIWDGVQEEINWYTDKKASRQLASEHRELYDKVRKQGWDNEMEKRQFAIDRVPEGNVMLIIDADTLMIGDPQWFREQVGELDTRSTMLPTMYYTHPASWWETPMLMKKVDGMKYEGIHWNITYPDTPERNQWQAPNNNGKIVEGCFQLNMGHFYRQPKRMLPKRESRTDRQKKEDFAEQRKKQIWDSVYHARRELLKDKERPDPRFV